MKLLLLTLFIVVSTCSFGQHADLGSLRLMMNDDDNTETFEKVDTIKGFVLFYSTDGLKYKEATKIDSVFTHSYLKYHKQHPTHLVYRMPTVEYKLIARTKEMWVGGKLFDLNKKYTFIDIKDLQ